MVIGFKQRMGLEANESAPIQSWAVGCKGLCGALVLFALLLGAPAIAQAGGDAHTRLAAGDRWTTT